MATPPGWLLDVTLGEKEPALTLAKLFEGEPAEDEVRQVFQEVAEHIRSALGGEQLRLLPVAGEMLDVLRERVEPVYEGG